MTPMVDRNALAKLQCLIDANPSIDWRTIALGDGSALDALDWCDLDPEAVMPFVKAYQRLVRILPAGEDHRAPALIASGLHSAIQVSWQRPLLKWLASRTSRVGIFTMFFEIISKRGGSCWSLTTSSKSYRQPAWSSGA